MNPNPVSQKVMILNNGVNKFVDLDHFDRKNVVSMFNVLLARNNVLNFTG